jgi:hypothetical protein
LDLILLALEKGWERAEIAGAVGVAEQEVDYVRSLVQRSAHMRTVCALGPCIH